MEAAGLARAGFPEGRSMTPRQVTGAGGVRLFVREGGNPAGPPLLLLHGWSQHHLCWSKQFDGRLAEQFRLIAPDLRGHGASDKPLEPEHYGNSAPWAGDVAALIEQLGLERPILVGWSMGGWIVQDYLRVHGDAAIAGAALIGSSVVTAGDPEVLAARSPAARAEGAYSEDQGVALRAMVEFVKVCVAAPLPAEDLAFMVGYNMLCPPQIRRAARTRREDYRADVAAATRPLAVFWGEAEALCLRSMVDETLEAAPRARLFTYAGAGHSPFWEQPEKFDADLAAFAREAFGASA